MLQHDNIIFPSPIEQLDCPMPINNRYCRNPEAPSANPLLIIIELTCNFTKIIWPEISNQNTKEAS